MADKRDIVPLLTGEQLAFFESMTTELVRSAGQRRDHFKTYTLKLTPQGFRRLVYAIAKCGGTLTVPPYEPSLRERE